MRNTILGAGALWLAALLPIQAHASLTTDLQGLESGLSSLNTQLATLDITSPGACGELGTLNTTLAM
ncbi:MAG TPA: hypothetical protein ENO16_00175 [Chromatiales bacterium]|nr:hypothetical protein [Chromatiales bacterium]